MADLLTLADLKGFLGVLDNTQDALLQPILDDVEATFEADCGRSARPFAAAMRNRCETKHGTGDDLVLLDYPIARIREITTGADPDLPDETLDPDDRSIVSWIPGSREIHRVDGGRWRYRGEPNVLRITYDSNADLPASPVLAIKRACAVIFRQLGAEELRLEYSGSTRREMIKACDDDPIWRIAVNNCRGIFV